MKNFETFIGIDWSGARGKRHKGIQVARAARGSSAISLIDPEPHRTWSRQGVADYLQSEASKSRVLVGIDCNFGLVAHKVREICGSQTASARDLWALVDRDSAQAEDFYAGPFFAARPETFWSNGKQPAWFDLKNLRRLTEHGSALGQPESPFKLIGPKQVGKGGLAGMRLLTYLKHEMGEDVAVWPFDPPEALDRAKLVITEIYPRLYLSMAGHQITKVTDISQLDPVLSYYGVRAKDLPLKINGDMADALVSAAALKYLCGADKTVAPQAFPAPHNPALTCEGWIFGFSPE